MSWFTASRHGTKRGTGGVLGVALASFALGVPLAVTTTSSAEPSHSAAVKATQAAPGVVTTAVSRQAQSAALAYWTPARLASAKPAMPLVKKSVTTQSNPSRTSVGGPAVTVAPVGAGGARLAAQVPAGTPSPVIHSRAYAYPAPFTRLQTFPNSQYNVFPNRVVGKLFFRGSDGLNYVCSASVVNSENKDVVWTAGHCVSNGAGRFHSNWVFAPARRSGLNPYGLWTTRLAATRTEWHVNGNLRQDVGALVMKDRLGKSITNAIGGLGISFNASRIRSWNAMGYPAASPFSGELQYQNFSSYAASDTPTAGPGPDTIGAGNDLTGGSSGGPWIYGYSAYGGWVNGVNSYKYIVPSMPKEMYSPYFGNEALSLYNAVRNA